MRVLFAGNKGRGVVCLQALLTSGYNIVSVLAHPSPEKSVTPGSVAEAALQMGLPLLQPANVNAPEVITSLHELAPDLIVLAGYGQIVKQAFINMASLGCINLHGGKLPQYRGSSPMNWALLNGEREFGISIIQVESGVDTGDVLNERMFPISLEDTIVDIQRIANREFPKMLLEVVAQIKAGTLQPRKQDETQAAYYPLRFPDDGLILWDIYTAEQIHNRVRALADPYPGAFTFFKGQRVNLLASQLAQRTYYGEPGRVYLTKRTGLLVCALDRCLWIQRAVIEANQDDAFQVIQRYEKFATARDMALENGKL